MPDHSWYLGQVQPDGKVCVLQSSRPDYSNLRMFDSEQAFIADVERFEAAWRELRHAVAAHAPWERH